jgi:hypothetical protein
MDTGARGDFPVLSPSPGAVLALKKAPDQESSWSQDFNRLAPIRQRGPKTNS